MVQFNSCGLEFGTKNEHVPSVKGQSPSHNSGNVYQMKIDSYVKQVQNDANVIKVPAGEISSANPGQKHGDQ